MGGGEAGQPLGTRVFGQFSLAGNRVASLHLETLVFLVGNHISDEQRNKEQERAGKSMREEATKIEIFKKRNPRREAEEEEETISKNIYVKLREIERETKHLFSFQVSLMFSFFNNKLTCLADSHIL